MKDFMVICNKVIAEAVEKYKEQSLFPQTLIRYILKVRKKSQQKKPEEKWLEMWSKATR